MATVSFEPKGDSRLPDETPAWTKNGDIRLGLPALFMTGDATRRMLRHEAAHSLHQKIAPRNDGAEARANAERIAAHSEYTGNYPTLANLLRPAPALLAYPPQTYSPWTKVWIGYAGLVGEVRDSGVAVRIFLSWRDLKISKMPEYNTYKCGKHNAPPIPTVVQKMKKAAKKAAELNSKIPDNSASERVALVAIFGETSDNAYRRANGKGLIVLARDPDFDKSTFENTIAHEGAHAVFEFHSVRKSAKKRTPDALALRFADLFLKLRDTKPAPGPTAKFNPRRPPSLKGGAQPAGLVMVTDTLWSGTGGHPWENADEFFASAYGGFFQRPKLLRRIVRHYQKADPKIKALSKELFKLLRMVGRPASIKKLPAPTSTKPAVTQLKRVHGPIDFTNKGGQVGWIIDPTKMPSPIKIVCRSSTKASTKSVDEILDELERSEAQEESKGTTDKSESKSELRKKNP